MNGQEVLALLYLEKRLFPKERSLAVSPDELTAIADAQAEMLRDIPFQLGKAAVAAHAASSPYAPAISEIRAYARRMTEPEPLSPDEAWSLAIRAVRRFGCGQKNLTTGKYPRDMARESVSPDVWEVMDQMGYQSMCHSQNEEVLRAQFIRAWERREKRRREREALLPFLPEGLKETFLGITEKAASQPEGTASRQ